MSDEKFLKSTTNLKQVVPLLINHKIPPTPANYALWYTYVDNMIPELTRDMQQVLTQYSSCPPSKNSELYNKYIADRETITLNELKSNIEVLLTSVSGSMTDTLSSTHEFAKVLDKSFSQLEKVTDTHLSMDEIMAIIRQLLNQSHHIRSSSDFLASQLQQASGEIQSLKEQLSRVQKEALFDSLTGLYNRRSFDQDLNSMCASQQSFALIILDIDHFKRINDTFGHLFGDAVLKKVAQKLQQNTAHEGTTAYRFGGEEFALIVPEQSLRITRQYAESLRRAISKTQTRDKKTGKIFKNITASFGVAEKVDSENAIALIERTDKLLYEAKQLGRNRVMPL